MYRAPSASDVLCLALNTGTGKPAVFPKWVVRVWVWYRILAHRGTPGTRTMVSRVFTGILQIYLFIIYYYYILPLFDILRRDFRVEFETPPNVRSSDHSLILRHGSHLLYPPPPQDAR